MEMPFPLSGMPNQNKLKWDVAARVGYHGLENAGTGIVGLVGEG